MKPPLFCDSLRSSQDSVVYELDAKAWETIQSKQPALAVMVMKICIRYQHHRLSHVSNRFVETRCISI